MNQFPSKSYRFDDFIFDPEKLALYHRNKLVKNTERKCLEVLAVLLKNPNQLTSHDEVVKQVWKDNSIGVNSTNIAQYVSKLRKILAEYEPGRNFIETAKGRGYMFIGELASEQSDFLTEFSNFSSEKLFPEHQTEETNSDEEESQVSSFNRKSAFFAVILTVFLLAFLMWLFFPQNDEKKIKQVVEDSQKYESLVLYKNPQEAVDAHLENYWLPETGFETESDITRIRAGVQRLIKEGKYYGEETKCEQFEFQSVEINEAKDFAIVKTLEKWFIAEYLADGTLHKNKTVGPYFVNYSLRKMNGRWLIEKSTTARAKPSPTIQ